MGAKSRNREFAATLYGIGNLGHPEVLEISAIPLRRVIGRGSRIPNGRFASVKMGRPVAFESRAESMPIPYYEFNPWVSQFHAQPVCLPLATADGCRRHIPDFAVRYEDQWELHEVKSDEDALDDATLEVAAAATRYLLGFGVRYRLILACRLRQEPLSSSIRRFFVAYIDQLDWRSA